MPEDRQPGSRPVDRGVPFIALTVLAVALVGAGAGVGIVAGGDGPFVDGAGPSTVASSSSSPSRTPSATPRPSPSSPVGPAPVATFDRADRSTDDPASLWIVVNKQRPLNPLDHAPADLVEVPVPHVFEPRLREEASGAVVAMFSAFTDETGLRLQSQSAYRGFDAQTRVYDQGVRTRGQASTDAAIARPGHSEHQTGLALDISALPAQCSLSACFADTPHGRWLEANAWRFGFLLRYPADEVAVTGYEFEPWHFRYIGVDLAREVHRTGATTLEEFFGLPAAPGY